MPEPGYKRCRVCNEVKPPSDFVADKRLRDGLATICRPCNRIRNRAYRAANPEQKAAYNRQYNENNPERMARLKRQWELRNPGKLPRPRDPARERAGAIVRQAVNEGKLVKPSACERCGRIFPVAKLDGHHKDYSMPLTVEWLCRDCHIAVHRAQ